MLKHQLNMDKNTISIEINKPINLVFEYTTNPINTPKWIPSILKEKAEGKIGIGTIYSQKTTTGQNALVITGFIKNKQLDFHEVNSLYTCSYRYKKSAKGTILTYSEENGVGGKIKDPMKTKNLQLLKKLIEE